MKKKLPKISLSRETLRQLDNDPLEGVGGGFSVDVTNCFACSNRNTCENYTACA